MSVPIFGSVPFYTTSLILNNIYNFILITKVQVHSHPENVKKCIKKKKKKKIIVPLPFRYNYH